MSALGERGKRYDADFKKNAVEIAKEHGVTRTAKMTGADKASISRWLQEAGIDPSTVATINTDKNRANAQASVAARQAVVEAAKERLARAHIAIAELSARKQIEILQGFQQNEDGTQRPVRGLPENVRLSEIVGAGTRAIHDFMLLTGNDTEKVSFRPSTEQAAQIRDELAARRQAKQAVGE